jgi:NAD(P)-dependent dehydrogenase (short-subunit alcohol dehydrogenase family)
MMPNFTLEGKSAIVTGATGILGKDFCRALASYKCNVVVVDRVADDCELFAKELRDEYGVRALGAPCDISCNKSVHDLVKEIEKQLGEIHVLHNNAATKTNELKDFLEDFENYKPETWNEIMGVNVGGMFNMCQAVGKHMIRKGIKGSIIQTASIYGVVAPDQRIYEGSLYNGEKISSPAVYSVSKAGVVGLTKYLASYWGHKGIRVNTLTPGGVESGQNEEFSKKYSARVPLGRMASRGDMLGALVFLASDASAYITGQNIIVDGGLSVW